MKSAWKKDRDHLVRPEADLKICRLAERVYGHGIPDWHGNLLDVTGRVVTLRRVAPGRESSDGASGFPDRIEWLGLDLAPSYLSHDAGYEEMDAMAEDPAWKAAGWTQPELRRLWDDLLGMMVRRQADALKGWKRAAGGLVGRFMRTAARALGGLAHGRLGALAAAALLAAAGCATPPDATVVEEWFWRGDEVPPYTVVPREAREAAGGEEAAGDEAAGEPPALPGEEAARIDWRYGGFDGSKAQVDERCSLSGLRVRESGMSVKWEAGIPGDWKRDKDGLVVCAAFHWDGRKWIGGKFDWIDESRTTRDWKNMRSGYNGWRAEPFFAAKRHAFCVVSADGKLRSNLVEER